jgi:hypothetical protein
MGSQPGHGRGRRMPVRVQRADGDDRHARPQRRQDGVRRCGGAAVVSDLEHVDGRQPAGQQDRVDVVLRVSSQQEAAVLVLAEHDDGGVVGLSIVGRGGIQVGRPHRPVVGPEHVQGGIVQPQRVARTQPFGPQAVGGQGVQPGAVVGRGYSPARFEGATDAVLVDDGHQAGDMVVVRMRQDDRVEPSVPGRNIPIEYVQEDAAVGAAVDEDSAASIALQEDRVALADVEHDHMDRAVRARGDHAAGEGDHEGGGDQRPAVPGPVLRVTCSRS